MKRDLSILYVEDDNIIRDNAVEYLGDFYRHIYAAKDGEEALTMYHDTKPDIIISDIKMPKRDGLALAKAIRETDKTTPIIITTAHTDVDYLLQAVELQLIKYLVKPISAKKLDEALTLALEHLHQNNIIMIDSHKLYDSLNCILLVHDKIIKLTKKEQLLLDILLKNQHRVVVYQEIENCIWYEDVMTMDALRALIRTLRIKLDADVYLENVSGIGYRFKVQDA